MKHGIALAPVAEQRARDYVVRPAAARQILLNIVGNKAKGYFRTPYWGRSYWSVYVTSGGLLIGESQSFKDMASDSPRPGQAPPMG